MKNFVLTAPPNNAAFTVDENEENSKRIPGGDKGASASRPKRTRTARDYASAREKLDRAFGLEYDSI